MSKKPSFQFYPGDWRKDQNLSIASKAAKGVFMDILCLAFESEKRGMLITGKKPWSIDDIAYAVGGDISENRKLIGELLAKKILKKDRNNVIFSSRMVHDEKISRLRREAGHKGGNPNLVKQKSNQTIKQKPTPSSSSSSSSSINTESTGTPDILKSNQFRQPKIPKLEDVVRVFIQQGGTEEMAISFFNSNQATGWFYKGSPIVNFSTMVPNFIRNWQNFDSKDSVSEKKQMHM